MDSLVGFPWGKHELTIILAFVSDNYIFGDELNYIFCI